MKTKRFATVIGMVAFLTLIGTIASAFPTILNYIPITDTVPNRTFFAQVGDFVFNFRNRPPAPFVNSSLIYSLTYGFSKAEIGVDLIADKSFSNPDSGLYAGPTAFNGKYRLMSEGKGGDRFSLAIGLMNLGVTRYDDQPNEWYVPSPYFILGKKVGDVRLHLGYQWNINGVKDLDTDRKHNNLIILGFDTVVVKHKKSPITLFVDYYGGRAGCTGFGLTQPFGGRWSWAYSYYLPNKDHLAVSRAEIPPQHYIGIGYSLPVR